MLMPKLSQNKKPKLVLKEKPISIQNDSTHLLHTIKSLKYKDSNKATRICEYNQKHSRNRSNSFKKRVCISIGSLESKKIVFAAKQNMQNAKNKQNQAKIISKHSLKIMHVDVVDLIKPEKSILIGSDRSDDFQRRKNMQIDKIKQNSIQHNRKHLKTSKSSQLSSSSKNGSTMNPIDDKGYNIKDSQSESSSEIFSNYKNSQSKSRKYSRVILNNSLSVDSAVFSFKIVMNSNHRNLSKGKLKLVQQCIEDPEFEWKFGKFKEYAQKYTEYEIRIKQNIQALEFLTQNMDLLKERIAPFKSMDSLKQIVQILRPTLSQKEEYVHGIKMQMLQWKKKFFTNVHKIKQSLNQNIEQKYSTVFTRLHENTNAIQKLIYFFAAVGKRETVIFEKQDIQNLHKLLQPILMNQKQIIDEINLCQRDGQILLTKFNHIEVEWSHAFDIFNSTLQNCVNKCFVLSECIEQLFGKSSNDMFLTKGFQTKDFRDSKTLENPDCHICRWNQIKLKKVISQNTLAKDHLRALKHLIAN